MITVHVDLISGVTYIVYVGSSNDITDQVPDEHFGTIAASVQGTTLGRYATIILPVHDIVSIHLYTCALWEVSVNLTA